MVTSRMLGISSLLLIGVAALFVSTANANFSPTAPDNIFCAFRSRCFGWHRCPGECPSRTQPSGSSRRACFMDCTARCEPTCRRRRPKCNGFGSMCYDPRLVGGDGSMFYFHGEKDQDFCLVTDRSFHINGHFIGLRPEGRTRDYTWVQTLGLLFGSHKFSVGAKKVAQWDDNVDQLEFSYDGESFFLEGKVGAMWMSNDGQLRVERTFDNNVVEVVLDQVLSMLVQVVPITAVEDQAHNYQLPSDNTFAHLDMQFKFQKLSANVNGVLGETYQPDYVSPAKIGVKMPVLGGEDRFFTTGLFNYDCKANQFLPETSHSVEASEIIEPFNSQCSSKGDGTGIVCRR